MRERHFFTHNTVHNLVSLLLAAVFLFATVFSTGALVSADSGTENTKTLSIYVDGGATVTITDADGDTAVSKEADEDGMYYFQAVMPDGSVKKYTDPDMVCWTKDEPAGSSVTVKISAKPGNLLYACGINDDQGHDVGYDFEDLMSTPQTECSCPVKMDYSLDLEVHTLLTSQRLGMAIIPDKQEYNAGDTINIDYEFTPSYDETISLAGTKLTVTSSAPLPESETYTLPETATATQASPYIYHVSYPIPSECSSQFLLLSASFEKKETDGETLVSDAVAMIPINGTGTTMYRLYNPNSGEHFYTADLTEKNNVVAAGWTDEGNGWTAPKTGDPVYRLYNKNGGEHHYTMSAEEKNNLVSAGWSDEGIGWYSDTAKKVPVYREYNPNAFSNNHNYTANKTEHDYLVSIGWKDEGIGWYGIG